MFDDEDIVRTRATIERKEDTEAMLEMNQQVHDLFRRLDIPISSIPLGSTLPWRSFESLLVNHAVRKTSKQVTSSSTSPPRPTFLGSPSTVPSYQSVARSALTVKHGDQTRHHIPDLKHNRGFVQPQSSARKREKTTNAMGSEPPLAVGGDRDQNPQTPSGSFNPAVHSLSLMLMNDSTHIPTIDTTLHDMKIALRRMDGMTVALSSGKSFRPKSDTAIEQGVIYDPELRTIAELQRKVEILMSDVATHEITIRRLENELRDKKLVIQHLKEDLDVYRSRDPFSGEEEDFLLSTQEGSNDDEEVDVYNEDEDGAQTNEKMEPEEDHVDEETTASTSPVPAQTNREDKETSPVAPSFLTPVESICEVSSTTAREVSEANSDVPCVSFADDAKTTRAGGKIGVGGVASLKQRFQKAVRAIKLNPLQPSQSQPFSSSLSPQTKHRGGGGSGPTAVSLSSSNPRARLSISAVVAFQEAVLDAIDRRHRLMGDEVFNRTKRAAMFEASLMDHWVEQSAVMHSASSFRTVSSLREVVRNRAKSSISMSTTDPTEAAARDEADNFFAMNALRILDPPHYSGPRAQPFGTQLFFLSIAIANKYVLAQSFETSVWFAAVHQMVAFVDRSVKDYGGHIISSENHEFLVVFDSPRCAVACALDIQAELPNSPNVVWPHELENNPMTASSRDVHSTVKRFVWRGLRLAMCLDVAPSGPATCVRDVADFGAVIYNGSEVRNCQWIASNLAPTGAIVLQERFVPYIEAQSVELDDPMLSFWSWRFLPGATTAVKMFDCYHRTHVSRHAENVHAMRLMYSPLQLRILTDPTIPATLERLVMLHNQQMTKLGVKPVTREDESILGLEGPVEQRLGVLRTLPKPTSDDFRPPPEDVFLAHVPPLPAVTLPDNFQQLPAGDVCLIVVVIPGYDTIVKLVDDALASSFARRILRLCKELALRPEFGSVQFIRSSRDRLLFATSEPLDAVRYCIQLQDQLFHLSPWPRDASFPVGLSKMLEPKMIHRRVVCDGPAVHCSVHMSKVKIAQEAFGVQQPYYTGSELDTLEWMTYNAPECVSSIYLSDTMFAILFVREQELTLPQPFIECVGIIDKGNELRCVYSMTPRSLVGRLLLFPAACWHSYRRWAARQKVLGSAVNAQLVRQTKNSDSSNKKSAEHAIVRFSPVDLNDVQKRALRSYYLSADRIHRARQLRPSYLALSSSNSITSTKVQGLCSKLYFDGSRKEQRQHQLLGVAVSVAAHRGRVEDLRMAEMLERSVMEQHDTLMPMVLRGRSAITASDLVAFQEMVMAGGGGASQSAFVAAAGSASANSTPKSSSHQLTRTNSGRALDGSRRLGPPPHLNLGGSLVDHGVKHTPRGPSGLGGDHQSDIAASSPRTHDNHEIRALMEIDKERQFMVRRTKKIEAEVRLTHSIVQCFMQNIDLYVQQLLSTQAKRISDEEVILSCMKRLNALREQSKKWIQDSDDEDLEDNEAEKQNLHESSSDDSDDEERKRSKAEEEAYKKNVEKIRINERWRDSLASVVEFNSTESGDYDTVLLCRSIVGQMCRHFLGLRTLSWRFSRTNDALERAQRTMDPNTKIGKAVEVAAERDLERRRQEELSSKVEAAQVIQLGELEEDPMEKLKAPAVAQAAVEVTATDE